MKFSPNEIKLFEAIGIGHLMDVLDPSSAYTVAVGKVFMENQQGAHIEALRRGYTAFRNCTVWRNTEEWEKLIEF